MTHAHKHAPRTRASTEPVEQAKEAIALLEQRIRNDFGYHVSLGAELEFVVRARDSEDHNPLGLVSAETFKQSDYTPQSQQHNDKKRDPVFPDSPYVSFSYKETDADHPYHKYETVISHRAVEKEQAGFGHSRGNLLGRVIEQTSAMIAGDYGKGGMPKAAPFSHVAALRNKVDMISQEPFVKTNHHDERIGITNGLHINVGVTPIDPASVAHSNQHAINNICVNSAIEAASLDNVHLLGTDDASMVRYFKRHGLKLTEIKGEYVENAAPSMATNPYYAVLVTLAGVYAGLALAHDGRIQEGRTAYQDMALEKSLMSVAAKAEACFAQPSNSLRAVLNHIDPGRGDAFVETIQKHPPGTEHRRVQEARVELHQGSGIA